MNSAKPTTSGIGKHSALYSLRDTNDERRDTKSMSRARPFVILTTLAITLWWMSRYYGLEITVTDSVPYHFFWLKKRILPHKGDWASFVAPENGAYPESTHFTKQMVGAAGDAITFEGRELLINGQYTAYAKRRSKTGESLHLSQPGILPAGYYFAHAPHQDSFDSRYQNIGWIHESQILGTAVPLL